MPVSPGKATNSDVSMTKPCRAPHCQRPSASGFSVYCDHHKARLRRHGAVDQDAITAAMLKPYVRRVKARIEKNRDNPAWAQLDRRWLDVVDHARRILGQFEAGRAGLTVELKAATEVRRVADDGKVRDVVVTALAMFVLQACEPRRFKSDAGFRFQLVRRVRSLGDAHAGMSYDHASGKTRRVYREVPPQAMALMGQWLAEALGSAGIRVAELELEAIERVQDEQKALRQALDDLK